MVVKRKPKPLLIIIVVIAIIFLGVGFTWIYLASPVESGNSKEIEVEITSGTSTAGIGKILKKNKLIKSELLFKIYVKLYSVNSLKASTYIFNQGMKLDEIIKTLENGSTYNPNMVKLTFKEGERVTDYAAEIAKKTNNSLENVLGVFKDSSYMQELITKYWFLTEDILNPTIYYPLEGYLAPDTYHFDNKEVEIKEIIEKMLKQEDKRLAKFKSVMKDNVHDYLTMASMVELEGTNTTNRKMIVGIFNNRLKNGMNLGSDVTTYYGLQAAMTSDLTSEQFASTNAYNTRSVAMIGKMPIGPICNPSESSIEASLNPTASDYLFFVADKHGNIFYTKNNKEHDSKVAEIKAKGDWIW